MAKTRGPLMSISASGAMGKISFNTTGRNNIARSIKPFHTDKPTDAQAEHRILFAAISAAWQTLTPDGKQLWNDSGVNVFPAGQTGTAYHCAHGYALFVREYQAQYLAPGELPLIPAPYVG